MRVYTKHLNGVELRATDWLRSHYVSRDGKWIYNSKVPHVIRIVYLAGYQFPYHMVTPNLSLHQAVGRAWVFNPCPSYFTIVDHINNNTHDNRAENLRWVNQKLNMANLKFGTGISYLKKHKKWLAKVTDNGAIFRSREFFNQNDAKHYANNARKEKFLLHYKNYVQLQAAETPDYVRTPGLLYWRDIISGNSARTASFMS